MTKPISEMTEQELLKLLKNSPEEVKVYEWPDDIIEFISVYNLKSGKEPIKITLLYDLYKRWSKDPLNRHTFSRSLNDIFPKKDTFFLLNKGALNIKQEVFKFLKRIDKSKSEEWHKHFKQYLDKYSIKKGGLFIKDAVLFTLYKQWSKRKIHNLSFKQFNNICKCYFKNKFIGGHYWFGLDESIQTFLTEDFIKEMSKRNGSKKTNKKIYL